MKAAAPEMLRFHDYTLDVARGSLRTADREIELRPKSFEVLRCLVENADRLVTKDELIKTVWPNVIVTDESLMQCVSEVRHAIGDIGQTIIKTVPRRGYRFASPVSRLSQDVMATPPTARSTGRGPELPSIAVLPFINVSGDPQQEYFIDGMTEDIITELSRFSELAVIARNSTFQYKGKAVDVRQVGRELGARYVLEGSIRRVSGRVRISAQLIDAETGMHRWAERYDRQLNDVLAVQDEVACTIVALLAAHVNKAEAGRTLLKPPASWEAYDYYLRADEAYLQHQRAHSATLLYEARRLLEKSLSIDPTYARAYAMLSRAYVRTYVEPIDGEYLNPSGLDRAHELAQKAVQLDGNLPLAHAVLGWALVFKRRHDAAIGKFEHAVTLNANFTEYQFGLALMFAGEPSRAVEVLQANIRLDPFQNANRLGYMGHAYYMLKRYAEAVAPLRDCAARIPNFRITHLWLAAAHAQLGQVAEAKAEAAEVLRIEPDFTIERWKCTAVYRHPKDAEHLFDGLRKAGLPED
jgi:adenylate cyclase